MTVKTEAVATKRLSSGAYIDLANLTPEQIDIGDINQALNYIYRFTGHWKNKEPLTVAQHTKLAVKVCRIIFPDDPVVEFDVTIHDFAEAYTGDIATPLKRLFGPQFKEYEDKIEETVYAKLWTIEPPFTKAVYEQRKVCDLLALDIERRSIWASPAGKAQWPDIPMESVFSTKEKSKLFDEIQSERFVDLENMYNEIRSKF